MIQTMQSELFRIRKSRLFFGCLVLAAFFVFALALTFYHNSVNGMLSAISLVPFTEFLFSDYSLVFPLTLFFCLYFTEDFHTGSYSMVLSKGANRAQVFFGKLLAAWISVFFFLLVCFGVAYLSILMMGTARHDIEYSLPAMGTFLLIQCLCFFGYTAVLNLISYLLRHRIIVTIVAFFVLGVLYLYLTKISAALDMDYSLYKYWIVGLSHSLRINTIAEDFMPILITLAVYLFLPTVVSFSLFQKLDLRSLEIGFGMEACVIVLITTCLGAIVINLSRNIIVTSVVGVIYGFASCLFIGSERGFVIPGSFAYRVSMFFSDKSTYYEAPVPATIGGCISIVLCLIVMFLVGLIVFSHKKKIEN